MDFHTSFLTMNNEETSSNIDDIPYNETETMYMSIENVINDSKMHPNSLQKNEIPKINANTFYNSNGCLVCDSGKKCSTGHLVSRPLEQQKLSTSLEIVPITIETLKNFSTILFNAQKENYHSNVFLPGEQNIDIVPVLKPDSNSSISSMVLVNNKYFFDSNSYKYLFFDLFNKIKTEFQSNNHNNLFVYGFGDSLLKNWLELNGSNKLENLIKISPERILFKTIFISSVATKKVADGELTNQLSRTLIFRQTDEEEKNNCSKSLFLVSVNKIASEANSLTISNLELGAKYCSSKDKLVNFVTYPTNTVSSIIETKLRETDISCTTFQNNINFQLVEIDAKGKTNLLAKKELSINEFEEINSDTMKNNIVEIKYGCMNDKVSVNLQQQGWKQCAQSSLDLALGEKYKNHILVSKIKKITNTKTIFGLVRNRSSIMNLSDENCNLGEVETYNACYLKHIMLFPYTNLTSSLKRTAHILSGDQRVLTTHVVPQNKSGGLSKYLTNPQRNTSWSIVQAQQQFLNKNEISYGKTVKVKQFEHLKLAMSENLEPQLTTFSQNISFDSSCKDQISESTNQNCNCSLKNDCIVPNNTLATETAKGVREVVREENNSHMPGCGLQLYNRAIELDDSNSFLEHEGNECLCKLYNNETSFKTSDKLIRDQSLKVFVEYASSKEINKFQDIKVKFQLTTAHPRKLKHHQEEKSKKTLSQDEYEVNKLMSVRLVPDSTTSTTVESYQLVSNICDLSRQKKFSNRKPFELFKKNHLLKTHFSGRPNQSPNELAGKIKHNTTNSMQVKKYINDEDEDFDNEIDKAIAESIRKYENITFDKGIHAIPDTSHKSSQTDFESTKHCFSCKRSINLDNEDCGPSKRIKTYQMNNKTSDSKENPLKTDTSSLIKLVPFVMQSHNNQDELQINDFIDLNSINNLNDDFTSINSNFQVHYPNESIHLGKKEHLKITESMYEESSHSSDEFSLYDDQKDIDNGSHWSTSVQQSDSSLFSDHKVPNNQEKDFKQEMTIRLSTTCTPKKPVLRVGLSRAAKLKSLHQK